MRVANISVLCMAGLLLSHVALCCAATEVPPPASQSLVVTLKDGRTVQGDLDAQTNESHVWLRRDEEPISLRSGFLWTDLDRVEQGSTVESVEQFRARALSNLPLAPPVMPVLLTPSEPLGMSAAVYPPVRSLEVLAAVANFDGDAEFDGLRVVVMPLDARGQITPIDGQLDFTLLGKDIRRSYVLDIQPPPFPELGRWSVRLSRADFDETGAVVELPFKRPPPDLDLNLTPDGLLTARLGVSGQGTFDASDAWVLLQPPSRIRDDLQFVTRRRFHRNEHVPFLPTRQYSRTPNRRVDDPAR